MNIKTSSNIPSQEKLDSKPNSLNNFHIQIQCPVCGNIFILNEKRNYYCEICNRIYTENEIRARCGL